MFQDEDDDVTDLVSAISSVSTSDWEYRIDTNVHAEFSLPLSVDQCSSPSSDVSICNAMRMMEEIFKLSASIGSYSVYLNLSSALN